MAARPKKTPIANRAKVAVQDEKKEDAEMISVCERKCARVLDSVVPTKAWMISKHKQISVVGRLFSHWIYDDSGLGLRHR